MSENLEDIKKRWTAIKDPYGSNDIFDTTDVRNYSGPYNHIAIVGFLERSGFNLNDDATYAQLEEGLTRDSFYKHAAYNAVTYWLRHFHHATGRHENDTSGSMYYGLERVVNTIQKMRDLVAVAGFRVDANPLISQQWQLVDELDKQGHVTTQFKKIANIYAREQMYILGEHHANLQTQLSKSQLHWSKNGDNGLERILSLADKVINTIDEAKEAFTPYDLPFTERYEGEDGRMHEKNSVIPYSRERAVEIAQDCALLMCRQSLITAQHAFAQQEFSKRGGGFREEMLYFREILGYLDLARFDLDSEDTYKKLGTTKKEFLTCFHFESTNAGNPPIHSGYVGVRRDFPNRFKLQV